MERCQHARGLFDNQEMSQEIESKGEISIIQFKNCWNISAVFLSRGSHMIASLLSL